MAWKFPISTNTAIDLGTTDDVYVAHGVVIGAVGATAVYGDGVDHQIEINGTLATDNNAIMLDCAVTATVTSDISIGKAGTSFPKGPSLFSSMASAMKSTMRARSSVTAMEPMSSPRTDPALTP